MQTSDSLFDRAGGHPALLHLLRHFYADVRQHAVLGPIFENQIENWPEHIEKIARFWSQVSDGPSVYSGAMPARHIPLGLREEHFQAWLGLWDINCRTFLTADCAAEYSALARQIGQRLREFCGVRPAVQASAFAPGGFPPLPSFRP